MNCKDETNTGTLYKCGRCNEVMYCSKECEQLHLVKHETQCKLFAESQSEGKKFLKDSEDGKIIRDNQEPKILLTNTAKPCIVWNAPEFPNRLLFSNTPSFEEPDEETKALMKAYGIDCEVDKSPLDMTDEILYPYESLLIIKRRDCFGYCYYDVPMDPIYFVVHASDKEKGITYGDFYGKINDKDSPAAQALYECDHSFLEQLEWKKPACYEACFGS